MYSSSQQFDYTSMFLCSCELGAFLPAKVESVLQENDHSIHLSIKTLDEQTYWIQLCWHHSFARIGVADSLLARAEPASYTFSAALRSLLKGLILSKVCIPERFERVITLEFTEKLSESPKFKLVLEILGARSNLILLSASDSKILLCAYQVASTTTSRAMQISLRYQPPPAPATLVTPFSVCNVGVFHSLLIRRQDVSIAKALASVCRGMSPNIAYTMLSTAELDQEMCIAPPSALSHEQISILFDLFRAWRNALLEIEKGEEGYLSTAIQVVSAPHFVVEQSLFSPVRFINRSETVESNPMELSLLQFIQQYYSNLDRCGEFTRLRDSCQRRLRVKIDKAGDTLEGLSDRLAIARGGRATELRERADLITSYTHAWRGDKGDTGVDRTLECFDFATGERVLVEIPRDPVSGLKLTPSQYAQRLYSNSRKLIRSVEKLEAVLSYMQKWMDYLTDMDAFILAMKEYKSYDDILAMRDIKEEINSIAHVTSYLHAGRADADEGGKEESQRNRRGHGEHSDAALPCAKMKVKPKDKKRTTKVTKDATSSSSKVTASAKKKILQGLLLLRPFPLSDTDDVDSDGEDQRLLPALVVGRSSRQNERVTFEVARDHHLWFHVIGYPGSHCVLLLEPGQAASDNALQFAADVAAYYSQARGSTSVPVGYSSPRHIKRAPRSPPGSVTVQQQLGVRYGCPLRGRRYLDAFGPRD